MKLENFTNQMSNSYFTIFDFKYITQALTLVNSFKKYNKDDIFYLVPICIDSKKFTLNFYKETCVVNIPDILPTSLFNYLTANRSTGELCWLLKPIVAEYLMTISKPLSWVTYVDSDGFFYNNPSHILNNLNNFSIAVTPHNFESRNIHLANSVGRYNAGYISFKNNLVGKEALKYWKFRCIESTSSKVLDKSYGDQKYLDDIFINFSKNVYEYPAQYNIGPWNINNTRLIKHYRNQPVYYHFHGAKILNIGHFLSYSGNFKINKEIFNIFYKPYFLALKNIQIQLIKHECKINLTFHHLSFKNKIKKIFFNNDFKL